MSWKRRRAAATLVVSAGLMLTACGTGAVPHSSPSVPASPRGGAAPAQLTTQTLNQVDAQLGTVDNDLQRAITDLDDPQPDS